MKQIAQICVGLCTIIGLSLHADNNLPKASQYSVMIEVSIGELIDKITILEIKSERITNPEKLFHIHNELTSLKNTYEQTITPSKELNELYHDLKKINEQLWRIEDDIRRCELNRSFGNLFVSLARSVYFTNDQRYAIKRQINDLLGCRLVEVKEHIRYTS